MRVQGALDRRWQILMHNVDDYEDKGRIQMGSMIKMRKTFLPIFLLALLSLTFSLLPPVEVFARPAAQDAAPTPAQVIEAVNGLRLAYGLAPLSVHPVLMKVGQMEAEGMAAGMGGHWRPNNMSLGQWLLSLGYPLWGDLSMDGYRSENWISSSSAIRAVEAWRGDDLHLNTMISPDRSDIGAGVASDGEGSYFVVLETALQTNTGRMQSDAYPILTGIPLTRAAYSSSSTQAAGNGSLPQFVIPVLRSTARPNGDVFHKVQYGQTLWSIAITYGTTIDRLRAWNNLGEDTTVYEGQNLLVQKGATQPPPATSSAQVSTPVILISKTPTSTEILPGSPSMTVLPVSPVTPESQSSNPSPGLMVGVFVVILLTIGWLVAFSVRKPE